MGKEITKEELVLLPLYGFKEGDDFVSSQVDILDARFGSLWTSIPFESFKKLALDYHSLVDVSIYNAKTLIYSNRVIYGKTFQDVSVGMPVLYTNSVNHMALAINQGSFAKAYNIGVGEMWSITLRRI